MSPCDIPSSSVDASSFAYVVGIDIGSHTCDFCVIKPDKNQVIKPTTFANKHSGFEVLQSKLAQLQVPSERVLIGLEATSRYGENLYRFLEGQGYQLWRLASQANPSVR
jgi:transposase